MKATVLSVLMLASLAPGGESPAVDQAKAALALAAAKRDREADAVRASAAHCMESHGEAAFLAAKLRKPLILWVGMKCEDSPAVRRQLPDAVHCHLESFNGDDSPRIVFAGADGVNYRLDKEQLGRDGAARVVRTKAGLPAGP